MPTFNGIDLTITLDAGITEVNVQDDLYSPWKDWVRTQKTNGLPNFMFPQAFRTVGGDDLTPGIQAGAYFFLQNDAGWRIRPAEEDATVLVVGNLAPEDSSLPMTIPTSGGFTVLLQGLQPITQSVEDILLGQQLAAYDGVVSIDTINGISGINFPVGTRSVPVNNLAEAVTIATNKNLSKFEVRGNITLTQAFLKWSFKGVGTDDNDSVMLNGQDVSGSSFEDVILSGTMVIPTTAVDVLGGRMNNVVNFMGHIEDAGFEDDVIFSAGQSEMVNCFSMAPGNQNVILNLQDLRVDLFVRNFIGVFQVSNHSFAGSIVSVDILGKVTLNSSVNGGSVNVRGIGKLVDNSGILVTTNISGFVDSSEVRGSQDVVVELQKLMRNTMITDPITGILTVFDDDDITILFQASLFEDAAGLQAYRGKGAERRSRLNLLGQFGPEFSSEFA